MRINYLLPRCTPDNSHGNYVTQLVRCLGAEHDITIYTGQSSAPAGPRVHFRFLPVPVRPAIARIASLWASSLVAARIPHADIVHIQGADAPVGDVVTAHCCNAAMRIAAGGRVRLRRRFNYSIGVVIERFCMSKDSTKRIIAVSNKVKLEIERYYGVDPQRVVVVPLGVDSKVFDPSLRITHREETRRTYGFRNEDFVVLFVGGDFRLKGLETLLAACRRMPLRTRALAVGALPDAGYTRRLAQLGLSDLVVFAGKKNEIAPLYAAADCFVLPTLYDTFSLATMEAMASGLPVIVSRHAGVSELLHHGQDALLLKEASDAEELAAHLNRLAEQPDTRMSLGHSARETAGQYSWERVALKTLAVYSEILSNR